MDILVRLKFLDAQVEQSKEPDIEDDESMRVFREAADEIVRLRAEVEALRVDAERYRWLCDPCSGAERVIFYCRGDYGRGLMSGTTLDAAIDAARGNDNG